MRVPQDFGEWFSPLLSAAFWLVNAVAFGVRSANPDTSLFMLAWSGVFQLLWTAWLAYDLNKLVKR